MLPDHPDEPAPASRPCRRPPRLPSCPSAATSSRATPRPPTRSKPSWPAPWRPATAIGHASPGPWCPGSATRCCPTTRSKPTAATSWTSSATCRPRASTPLEVTADHVKLYKRALLEAGMTSATVARRLSVLRGAYEQLAAKGLISWETAQDIAAVKAPGVQKNATPVADPAAGDRPAGGDPHRHPPGHPRPGADERLLPHRLPGLGGDRRLRRAPGDRRRRALPPFNTECCRVVPMRGFSA